MNENPAGNTVQSIDKWHQGLVTRLMFLPDNPVRADATLVLGISLWQNPLEAALRLFHGGRAGKLVFSGGHNDRIGRAEAEVMAEAAIARGVPTDMVLSESRARNTRENVEFGWDLIRRNFPGKPSVNIVAITYHIPRALMTARALIGSQATLGHTGYGSIYFNADTWHQSERGQRDVLNEAAKLARYFPDAIPTALWGRIHGG